MVAAASVQPHEILVADDESVVRDVLQVYLESFGCRVRTAWDGETALRLLQSHAGRIGLVILDVRMPGLTADALCDRIHALAPALPILICSGAASESPDLRFVADRGLRLLAKPFNRSDLLRAITDVLDAAQTAGCGITRTVAGPPRCARAN